MIREMKTKRTGQSGPPDLSKCVVHSVEEFFAELRDHPLLFPLTHDAVRRTRQVMMMTMMMMMMRRRRRRWRRKRRRRKRE